jgi:hypothetical protein
MSSPATGEEANHSRLKAAREIAASNALANPWMNTNRSLPLPRMAWRVAGAKPVAVSCVIAVILPLSAFASVSPSTVASAQIRPVRSSGPIAAPNVSGPVCLRLVPK